MKTACCIITPGRSDGDPGKQALEVSDLLQECAYYVGKTRTLCRLYQERTARETSTGTTSQYWLTVCESEQAIIYVGPCELSSAMKVFDLLTKYEVALCHVADVLEETELYVPVHDSRKTREASEKGTAFSQ